MIWLTWRQVRAQTIAGAVLLAAFASLLLVTSVGLADQAASSGLSACHGQAACQTAASSFLMQIAGSPAHMVFFAGIVLAYVVPALIGMFWGAPLIARELETGTFRLAWNQSVSRTRWVIVKLGLVGLLAMAAAGLISWMTGWWASPIWRASALTPGGSLMPDRISPIAFGAQGIAPLGYAAFAFAVGVTAGLLIKRTVPAMALTLGVFAFVQSAWPKWVRPHLVTPDRYTAPLSTTRLDAVMIRNGKTMMVQASAARPGAWVLSDISVRPDGTLFTGPPPHACQGQEASMRACYAAIGRLHLRQVVTYQPVSRFWELQLAETGIFLALAVVLAGFCAWWVRRRRLA